jgi:hypothetical protein
MSQGTGWSCVRFAGTNAAHIPTIIETLARTAMSQINPEADTLPLWANRRLRAKAAKVPAQ